MNIFECSLLFLFNGVEMTSCSWQDDTTIKLYNIAHVNVYDSWVVFGGLIKAACRNFAISKCNSWITMNEVVTVVQPPTNPIYPSIQVSMPSQIGTCTNLSIDLSSSSGLCGRGWYNLTFEVNTKSPKQSSINYYLESMVIPMIEIPYELLLPDYDYSFLISGCNFLGQCTSVIKELVIVNDYLPLVRFIGAPIRKVLVADVVTLKTIAGMIPCNNATLADDADIDSDIFYLWEIVLNSKSLVSIDSLVKDSTKYVLPAYSLRPSSVYEVKVIAYVNKKDGSTDAATASVIIQTELGKLKAIISGSYYKSVKIFNSILVDASLSYDTDVSPDSSEPSGLTYTWDCTKVSPMLSDSCGLYFIPSSNSSVIFSASSIASINTTSLVTVTVSDAITNREAKASTEITVIPPKAPLITINYGESSLIKDNALYINPSEKLKIYGLIEKEGLAFSSSAQWVVEGGVDLEDISLTSLQIEIPTQELQSVTPFNLVLKMDALPSGSTFVFKLVVSDITGLSYSGIANVMTNGAPFAGYLNVYPLQGIALQTEFLFAAFNWEDDDIPLTYTFGFTRKAEDIYSRDKILDIRSRSELSYCSSILPAGETIDDIISNLTTLVTVYDCYDASTVSTNDILVTPIKIVTNSLISTLVQLPKDVDSILPLLSAAISTVSTVNCTSAPQNCFDDFNRLPCAQVTGTCGKCRPGYVGEDSDSNTPCINPADFLLLNNTLKPCEGNCSSHGSCIYVQVNTDEEINECMITDVNCKAICDCHDGYSGSSCSMDEAELTDKMALKSQILNK